MASPPLNPFIFDSLPSADTQIDFYEEEDVDQLDSDSEVDDDPDSLSAKKGSSKKDGKRIPGQTLLPGARLETIIQADGTRKHCRSNHERPTNLKYCIRRHWPPRNVEGGLLPRLHRNSECSVG